MPVQEWCPGAGVAGHVIRGYAVPGGGGGVGVGVTGPPTAWRHYSLIMWEGALEPDASLLEFGLKMGEFI